MKLTKSAQNTVLRLWIELTKSAQNSCFEVVDRTDEVSSKHCFEVVDRTDEVSTHTYSKAKLTWFEEIFEEYQLF
ncbi:N-ethylammeline chlorohydrolase [Streptococcus pneumoniae]|nr:N-ethylammeline chlorohydrolase [Streptococcus pneumoniae]